MTLNVQQVTERFAAAVRRAEISLAMLFKAKWDERLLLRHCRDLRRCDRIRTQLKAMIEQGKL